MIQEKFENEDEIRRFLLGEMSDGERAAFEDRFIAEDADLFDRIGVVEDELIESYVRGTLSSHEKTKFEKNFLTGKNRRARVVFTREMFDKLDAEKAATAKKTEAAAENSSVLSSLLNLFKTPRIVFGAGFAILVLVFGLWFLVLKKSGSENEIVRQTTPNVTATPQINGNNQNAALNTTTATNTNINSANNPEANKTPAAINAENSNKLTPKETAPKPVVATLALFTGTVRSEGKTSELNLTKDVTGANFVLNLESSDYKTYRAEIVDADGSVVYRSGRLTPRKNTVNAYFPTARLKRGDYFVKLYGLSAAGAEESAADFQFRVNQR